MAVTRALLQAAPVPTPTQNGEFVDDGEGWEPFEWLPYSNELEPFYRLVVAMALLALAVYVSRLTRRILGRRIARRFTRPSVSRTILRGIQAVIVAVGVVAGLAVFGIGFGNLALSVGVFSAVAGIILAPIIGNVLSGFFVLSEQPYEIGDMIELEDTQTKGFVEEITLLYTKIFTLDNSFMVLPNGNMRDRDVINYSAEDTRIRMTLDVGVSYESDLRTARAQLEAAARNVEGVIKGGPDIRIGSARYPAAPVCYIREFADDGILLRLRYWAKEPYKQTKVQSNVLTGAWERFDEHEVDIPYPHRHLVFDDTSGELQVGSGGPADALGPGVAGEGPTVGPDRPDRDADDTGDDDGGSDNDDEESAGGSGS